MSSTESATYVDFTNEQFSELRREGKAFALFFHAGWCPPCKKLDAEITANMDALPVGATILKVDYDSSPLVKQLGVRQQHTAVFFNENGNTETVVGFDMDDLKERL